ncbi:DedA family protein [Nitrospira defluvii]|nr:DedA family protein [Nitrospira defluvii]
MAHFLIQYIELGIQHAAFWGFLFVFVLMTIESSFIPFPSEVVMIPAGFLAYRSELLFASPMFDLCIVIFCGTLGSIVGAYINYFLFLKLGRPFLYRHGKYFLLSPPTIARAEEIFNRHGEITTFICRLLPGIRQIISIPAGLARMPLFRFTLFTTLGAGIWSIVLALTGYYLASLAEGMSYADLVVRGKDTIRDYFPWLILGLSVIICGYIFLHRTIMKSDLDNIKS